jgi:hypothetical protein
MLFQTTSLPVKVLPSLHLQILLRPTALWYHVTIYKQQWVPVRREGDVLYANIGSDPCRDSMHFSKFSLQNNPHLYIPWRPQCGCSFSTKLTNSSIFWVPMFISQRTLKQNWYNNKIIDILLRTQSSRENSRICIYGLHIWKSQATQNITRISTLDSQKDQVPSRDTSPKAVKRDRDICTTLLCRPSLLRYPPSKLLPEAQNLEAFKPKLVTQVAQGTVKHYREAIVIQNMTISKWRSQSGARKIQCL